MEHKHEREKKSMMTKEELQYFWSNRDEIFRLPENRAIIERFEKVGEVIDKLLKLNVSISDDKIMIDSKELKDASDPKGGSPNAAYFGPADDDICSQNPAQIISTMENMFPDYKELVRNTAALLGGFEFAPPKKELEIEENYRLVSCTKTKPNDNGFLTSANYNKATASQFATNTYFFQVADTLKKIKESKFKPDESRIALRHHNWKGNGNWDNVIREQRESLRHRFPYKFFYMWTHRDDVIHPLSLKAYRELISQLEDHKYDPDASMDQAYDEFIKKWPEYSDKLRDIIPQEERGDNFIREFSKLLSVLTLEGSEMISTTALLLSSKALVLYGVPGTGKTWLAKRIACKLLNQTDPESCRLKDSQASAAGAWDLVQFHPGYGYEDFMGGIFPKLGNAAISYELKNGSFKTFCEHAASNPRENFVFIIDEINRADLSAVFGELLYALEYRGEPVRLPSFNTDFVIPENVYIIGTMNTADKSLVSFDLALRRRFSFKKLEPDMSVLASMLEDTGNAQSLRLSSSDRDDFIKRCEKLNEGISNPDSGLGLDENYRIGHAYFGKIRDFLKKVPPVDADSPNARIDSWARKQLWSYHLEPLIEEYLGSRGREQEWKEKLKGLKKAFID